MTDEISLPIHKSDLMSFRRCPRQYKYRFIDQMPEIGKARAAEIGIEFHEVASRFYGDVDYNFLEQLKSESEANSYFLTVLPKGTSFDQLISNFALFEAHRWWVVKTRVRMNRTEFFRPYLLEKQVLVDEMLGFKGPWAGRMDRVDKLTTQEFAVIEFKSGNLPKIVDFRAELAYYSELANAAKLVNPPIHHIGGYSPKANEWFFERTSVHTLRALKRFLGNFLAEYGKFKGGEDAYTRKIAVHCIFCPYAGDCLFGPDIGRWEKLERSKFFTFGKNQARTEVQSK